MTFRKYVSPLRAGPSTTLRINKARPYHVLRERNCRSYFWDATLGGGVVGPKERAWTIRFRGANC